MRPYCPPTRALTLQTKFFLEEVHQRKQNGPFIISRLLPWEGGTEKSNRRKEETSSIDREEETR